ncbi:hydantoinase/oxoprolinase family protein [Aquibium sp. LZ166]|uniref:Hydantoinase/oxoprolinase family protein n=1 Tax=Aquibium pacificus TaxID=3153579 RepID=A0ABV3SN87_9HYPH
MSYRVGVDVGGSFTDFAVLNEITGELRTLKVFSRPDSPGSEVLWALETLAKRDGLDATAIIHFAHGTTVGINTVIQRNGPDLALFTTVNFEDVLEIARLKIPQMHNLYSRRPRPLIPRDHVFGIAERTNAQGEVVLPPDPEDLAKAVRRAREAGCSGIIVAFLHAYRNAENERQVRDMIFAADPGMTVVTSSETWPIIREYERTITAVISGYVQPRVAHYLDGFEETLRQRGVQCPLLITKTNGGVMDIDQARRECVQMIMSGTASGVIGAGHLAMASGFDRIISLDIGGTSADVAVIVDGVAQYGTGELIGDFHIHIPSVSVSSVGQGGGSVAWLDTLGHLRVGPESAGSSPGPACYGRGGTKPTITDAMAASNLIGLLPLGYGAVSVDQEAARRALARLADRLGIGAEELAGDIIGISVSGMYAEISALIARFAIDPRNFHLFAFGGAGAMLACFLAQNLDMKGVVVPPSPGVVSALGALIADLRNDFIHTVYADVAPETLASLGPVLDTLEAAARDWLQAQGHSGEHVLRLSADMRYPGQSFEIETPLDPRQVRAGDAAAVTAAFHSEHARLYGHADRSAGVELISLRLVVTGPTPKPPVREIAAATGPAVPLRQVRSWFAGRSHVTDLYQRTDLAAGHHFSGPAIIAQEDTTTVIPPGFHVQIDRFGNLVIAREESTT